MEPLDIRIELLRAKIKIADIARYAKVSPSAIGRVIEGQSRSARLERLVAKAIDKPVEAVFPARNARRVKRDREISQRLAG